MERGFPLIARVASLLMCCWLAASSSAATRQLVLVASAKGPAQTLTNIEIRMLFLGYEVSRGSRVLRPVRNVSGALINDVFLQHVVAMSQAAFDRRTLVATLQKGRPPPAELATTADVIRRLDEDVLAVSYMWLTDVEPRSELRVLRVLWVE